MFSEYKPWVRFAVFNLLIVAGIGVVLRYKIAFSLPWVDQKNLLQSHSHFAFAGWLTQLLMTLVVRYLNKHGIEQALLRYKWVLIANGVTAYGMLVTFPFEGYGLFSIIFSTLSIFVSYAFAVMVFYDAHKLKKGTASMASIKASVAFNAISSIGAFSLAYMMATHNHHERLYLMAIYFFLHFQYNGWFFFASMGLLFDILSDLKHRSGKQWVAFRSFFYSCFPAYFLSVLWLKLPVIIYSVVVLSAFIQLIAWIILWPQLREWSRKVNTENRTGFWLLVLSALAFTIKLLLQAGSTHPSLSQLAFGFRPIVIGYLHLVLLGVISIFLLAYIYSERLLADNKSLKIGLVIFISGIIINEILLMIQGVCGIQLITIDSINYYLFAAALIMFSGVAVVNRSQISN